MSEQIGAECWSGEVGGGGYVRCGEKLLLFRRSEQKSFPGSLMLPGGRVDAGEDVSRAILRELAEETGVVVEPDDVRLRVVALHEHFDRKELYVIHGFEVEIDKVVELKDGDEDGVPIWMNIEEARQDEKLFEPVKIYFDHVLEGEGIMYTYSTWEKARLVEMISQRVGM